MIAALISNPVKDKDLKISGEIAEYLYKKGVSVLSDTDIPRAGNVGRENAVIGCDTIITVGGDGTILKVAQLAAEYDKPILGVNMGKLGYMTSMEPYETKKIDMLLEGKYKIDRRSTLSVSASSAGDFVFSDIIALNDAVISHGVLSKIIDIDLRCNSKQICTYRADGLIFATPTGSTAYSLSAGGPIIDTELDAVAVTPICAHSFNSRSIIFKDKSVLEADFSPDGETAPYITIDGIYNYKLSASDSVKIALGKKRIGLIRFGDDTFYNILSKKIR